MTPAQNEVILEVEGVSKLFSRSVTTTRQRMAKVFWKTLFHRSVEEVTELESGEFWSIDNVSFTLRRGESLGIIGFNGAGKTTLLRILAGQMLPDNGEVRVWGKSVSMIDLTAGFSNSASGRKNIYLRGAMLGRSRAQIDETLDEIIEFAELGDAIDAPINTYSSGMRMRLAFSIMITTDPDILFIDEVLAVGDFAFKQKCLAKIREIRERTAFVMVTHSMSDVRRFCEKVLVMNHGQPMFLGDPAKAIEIYQELDPELRGKNNKTPKRIIPRSLYREDVISEVEHYWVNEDGDRVNSVISGEDIYFHCSFRVHFDPKNLIVGVPVYTMADEIVTGLSTDVQKLQLPLKSGEKCNLKLKFSPVALNPGTYQSAIGVVDGIEFLYMEMNPELTVSGNGKPYWGHVSLQHNWERLS